MKIARLVALSLALLTAMASEAFSQAQPSQLLHPMTSWAIPGAAFDMDWGHGRYIKPVPLTITRAQSNSSISTALDRSGNYQQFAANVLRKTDVGVFMEERRDNSLRNNRTGGAAAGSPGTLPTNWTEGGVSGVSRQVVSTQTEANGVETITLRYTGTAASTASVLLQIDTAAIAATYGQTWTLSTFFSAVINSGSTPTFGFEIDDLDSGGGFLAGSQPTFSPTSSLARYQASRTLASTATGRGRGFFRFVLTSGQTYDFTVTIGWPQFEYNRQLSSTVASATVAAGGSGGSNGTGVTLTVTGGACSTAPTLSGTISGGALASIQSVINAGACSTFPPSPATVTGGSLTGATVNLTPNNLSSSGAATSPILTATGVGQRDGDYITVANPQWVTPSPLWMYWEFTPSFIQTTMVLGGAATATSFSNYVYYVSFSSSTSVGVSAVGSTGSAGSAVAGSPPTIGSINKALGAWYPGGSSGGGHAALNGAVNTNTSLATLPTAFLTNILTLGNAPWSTGGGNVINGYINRWALGMYPMSPNVSRALTNLNINY